MPESIRSRKLTQTAALLGANAAAAIVFGLSGAAATAASLDSDDRVKNSLFMGSWALLGAAINYASLKHVSKTTLANIGFRTTKSGGNRDLYIDQSKLNSENIKQEFSWIPGHFSIYNTVSTLSYMVAGSGAVLALDDGNLAAGLTMLALGTALAVPSNYASMKKFGTRALNKVGIYKHNVDTVTTTDIDEDAAKKQQSYFSGGLCQK